MAASSLSSSSLGLSGSFCLFLAASASCTRDLRATPFWAEGALGKSWDKSCRVSSGSLKKAANIWSKTTRSSGRLTRHARSAAAKSSLRSTPISRLASMARLILDESKGKPALRKAREKPVMFSPSLPLRASPNCMEARPLIYGRFTGAGASRSLSRGSIAAMSSRCLNKMPTVS